MVIGCYQSVSQTPGRGGGLTYVQGPHVTCGNIFKNFLGRVQMYDGCCSVRLRLKRTPGKMRAKVTTKKEKRSPEN